MPATSLFELELSLIFFVAGILFDRFGYPRLKAKLKERWLEEDYSRKAKKSLVWGEHKPCSECGSKTKHTAKCSENPKNKKVTA